MVCIQDNAFENTIWNMSAILFKYQFNNKSNVNFKI